MLTEAERAAIADVRRLLSQPAAASGPGGKARLDSAVAQVKQGKSQHMS